MLEQVAVRLRRDDAQVEPVAVVRDDGGLRVSLRSDLDDPPQRREVVDQRRGIAGGGDDVEVADRLLPAARAARAR